MWLGYLKRSRVSPVVICIQWLWLSWDKFIRWVITKLAKLELATLRMLVTICRRWLKTYHSLISYKSELGHSQLQSRMQDSFSYGVRASSANFINRTRCRASSSKSKISKCLEMDSQFCCHDQVTCTPGVKTKWDSLDTATSKLKKHQKKSKLWKINVLLQSVLVTTTASDWVWLSPSLSLLKLLSKTSWRERDRQLQEPSSK